VARFVGPAASVLCCRHPHPICSHHPTHVSLCQHTRTSPPCRPCNTQASICTELIRRLLQYGPALTAASAAVAELDCLCGLAAAARELGYCRPQLVTDSIIHIEGGTCPAHVAVLLINLEGLNPHVEYWPRCRADAGCMNVCGCLHPGNCLTVDACER
jgi:hypothetical protein